MAANMSGAVSLTNTCARNNAMLPFTLAFANKDQRKALGIAIDRYPLLAGQTDWWFPPLTRLGRRRNGRSLNTEIGQKRVFVNGRFGAAQSFEKGGRHVTSQSPFSASASKSGGQ